jgi:hypothetical protein
MVASAGFIIVLNNFSSSVFWFGPSSSLNYGFEFPSIGVTFLGFGGKPGGYFKFGS